MYIGELLVPATITIRFPAVGEEEKVTANVEALLDIAVVDWTRVIAITQEGLR